MNLIIQKTEENINDYLASNAFYIVIITTQQVISLDRFSFLFEKESTGLPNVVYKRSHWYEIHLFCMLRTHLSDQSI